MARQISARARELGVSVNELLIRAVDEYLKRPSRIGDLRAVRELIAGIRK
jgi:hypothetical protein